MSQLNVCTTGWSSLQLFSPRACERSDGLPSPVCARLLQKMLATRSTCESKESRFFKTGYQSASKPFA